MSKGISEYWWKFLIGFSGILYIAGTLLTFVNVVMRKAFNKPWTGTEEVDGILLVVVVFLPLSYLEWNDRHLSMSVFFDRFPPLVQFWVKKLQHLVILSISVFITVETWNVVVRNFHAHNKSASLGIPLYIPYSILLAGFGLTALTKLIQLFMSKPSGEEHVD